MNRRKYVLVTAARNEEAYIEGTIKSVLQQTLLPDKWVIVSDRSTDKTDTIAENYAQKNGFIEFVRKEHSDGLKGFASKVTAIALGCERLRQLEYDFLGNLDADLSFENHYYERLIEEFEGNPLLGIGGGLVQEEHKGTFRYRPANSSRSVAGGIQLFRRQCYEDIGGLMPFELGGEDWCAEIMARMAGWQVQAVPSLTVFHHKRSDVARGALREHFRLGVLDHSFGSHPMFEVAKCTRRILDWPSVSGAGARICGYVWAYLTKRRRVLPAAQISFLRSEQMGRLYTILKAKQTDRLKV